MLGARRQARQLALQALYEIDCAGHPVQDVMGNRLEAEPLSEEARLFAYQLVNGVLEHKDNLDRLIQRYAPEWPIDQIAIIDRNILRIAVYEVLHAQEIPLRVAINEAVELAKVYGSDTSPRFVNGVLGSLVASEEVLRTTYSSRDVDTL